MTTDRKHPTPGFWLTVALVAVLVAYLALWGPVIWIRIHIADPPWLAAAYFWLYSPIVWLHENGPSAAHDAIDWYGQFWW